MLSTHNHLAPKAIDRVLLNVSVIVNSRTVVVVLDCQGTTQKSVAGTAGTAARTLALHKW